MEIKLKHGIGQLVFGMKPKDVVGILGLPNKQFLDEDENKIYQYNHEKLHLTFYEDEDFRLGYIVSASQNLKLFDKKIIHQNISEIKKSLELASLKFVLEDFDTFEHYFNDDNWLILSVEFDEITKVEIGAIIKDDEFVWKF
jgi:hypothetical protein